MLCICLEERGDLLARGDGAAEEDVARAVRRRVRRRDDRDLAEEAGRRVDRLAHVHQHRARGEGQLQRGTIGIVQRGGCRGDEALVGGDLRERAVDRGHLVYN